MRFVLFFALLLSFTSLAWAQAIYEENFEDEVVGATVGGNTYPDGGDAFADWTRDVSGANLADGGSAEVTTVGSNNVFQATDTDGPVTWETQSIDISGRFNVAFRLAATEVGSQTASDTYVTEYSLDGGAFTTADVNGDLSDDFGEVNVGQSNLSGSSLVIRVTISNTALSKEHRIDDVIVTGSTVNVPVTINEIHADPDATNGDANNDGSQNGDDEFVELVNTGDQTIDMEDYTLSDAGGVQHTFPAGTLLESGSSVVVFGGGAVGSGIPNLAQNASTGSLSLNNGGDTVTLRDDSGNVIAEVTYDSAGDDAGNDDQSITRSPDLVGTFIKHTLAEGSGGDLFSPGTRLTGGPFSVSITGDTGWRMLSAPVTGLEVGDLASISLVQGVTGSFPSADANVFTYNGASFEEATSTEQTLEPGEGFIWYLWDNDNATSRPFPVTLTAEGTEPGAQTESFGTTDFLLSGNPFQAPIDVGAITVDAGTLVNDVQVWNPNNNSSGSDANGNVGTYEVLSRNENDVAATWQGFFLQRTDNITTEATIPTSAKRTVGTFYGKRGADPLARLRFRLEGDGVLDKATSLVVAEGATLGFDQFDASKLTPLSPTYAAIAFEGEKDGEAVLKTTESLPLTTSEAHVLPMKLDLVGFSGALTLTWEETGAALPEDWAFVLVDNLTGDEIDLLASEQYVFEASAPANKRARTFEEIARQPVQLQAAQSRFTLKVGPASSVDVETETPFAGPELEAAFPNPFAHSTTLTYAAPTGSEVRLAAYDVLGRQVALVASGTGISATQTAEFDASDLPSGVYVLRLTVDGRPVGTQTVTVVR